MLNIFRCAFPSLSEEKLQASCCFPQDLYAVVCGVRRSITQPTQARMRESWHGSGRDRGKGGGSGGDGGGSRRAKVQPQQADWSSEVERLTRSQTLSHLARKNIRCWFWRGRVQSRYPPYLFTLLFCFSWPLFLGQTSLSGLSGDLMAAY